MRARRRRAAYDVGLGCSVRPGSPPGWCVVDLAGMGQDVAEAGSRRRSRHGVGRAGALQRAEFPLLHSGRKFSDAGKNKRKKTNNWVPSVSG